jgi:V/A-type H+-transporting ATPase subunit E
MANLAALLEREASAEIEAILSEARQRASEIVAEAEEDAKAMTAQRERLSQTQSEAARVRAQSAAQLEASSLKLRAQHSVVEEVFKTAQAEIRSLVKDDKRYTPVFAALLEEAVTALGGKDNVAKITVNPADETRAREAAKKHGLEGKVDTDAAVEGGVKVKAVSNVTVENSLLDRLQAAREELASEVSRLLGASSAGSAGQPAAQQPGA